jgi:hypothetical protein
MDNNFIVKRTDIQRIGRSLLAESLKALTDLTFAADGDIYTDAPEYQASVNQVQDAIQKAYEVIQKIHLRLVPINSQSFHSNHSVEALARRILDESEEAFAALSMAKERASNGNWPEPSTIPNYLFWIEDEARLQEECGWGHLDEISERSIYARALRNLADELLELGFTPSPAPWTTPLERPRGLLSRTRNTPDETNHYPENGGSADDHSD